MLQLDGASVWEDVGNPRCKVGVHRTRAGVEDHAQRSDDVEVSLQRWSGVNQDIGTLLYFADIDATRWIEIGDNASTDGGRRMIRIVAVTVWLGSVHWRPHRQ